MSEKPECTKGHEAQCQNAMCEQCNCDCNGENHGISRQPRLPFPKSGRTDAMPASADETLKRLEHLMPKCEWVPCDNPAKWTESDGRGGLVQVCTPHRRLLTKQKKVNNNV